MNISVGVTDSTLGWDYRILLDVISFEYMITLYIEYRGCINHGFVFRGPLSSFFCYHHSCESATSVV